MGRVFQPTYTRGGRSVRVRAWYVDYTDAGGRRVRERVGPKAAALALLAKREEEAARRRAGLPDLAAAASEMNRYVADLLDDYAAELAAREASAAYRANVARMLGALAAACGWHTWADVREGPVTAFLTRLRAGTKGRPGVSPSTANGYVRAAKGFAGWHAERVDQRNPLRALKLLNDKVGRRRSRRVLTDDELRRLIAAAGGAPDRPNAAITGALRAALYRVAAYTGLRAGELASLTPAHFELGADPPVVRVRAESSKGRREEVVPLHSELVAWLREWLGGRDPHARLWPGEWAKQRRQVKWIGRDARRAGLGAGVIFQGLRRRFVTAVIRSGADIDEVRRLARHRSPQTTLENYAETTAKDGKRAVDRLKPLAESLPSS